MENFVVGQRWISETEPELGLGIIQEVGRRVVTISFPATEEIRRYAADSAPVRRAVFSVGHSVKNQQGLCLTVEQIKNQNGLLFYCDQNSVIPEFEISASSEAKGPAQRVQNFDFDDLPFFQLRNAVLLNQYRLTEAQTAGFVGGRMDLIPHQLYIAHEVSKRRFPRVLLADEVGLGKTIEAALILHRLIRTHKIERVLILLPDSLVHQWLVELMRRFNLWFDILDENYCSGFEAEEPGHNPFYAKQFILCDLQFLVKNKNRAAQALAAEWDMVVVDEAHHLKWSPEASSAEYEFVLELAKLSRGLMLLTATPEQLGPLGHYARLRLLDPDRYHDKEIYLNEVKSYRRIASLGNKLVQGENLSSRDRKELAEITHQSADTIKTESQTDGKSDLHKKILQDLLDRHGIGRVMFRNTRSVMKNFPQRKVELNAIAADTQAIKKISDEQLDEYNGNAASIHYLLERDPRILWLDETLQKHSREKFLLICKSLGKAKAIEKALKERRNLKAALFHEELSLIQRDRQAAWFADPEGAQILISSEIGSEGRNFQFAHHLILFDIPYDPEVLEQRIGRLDRIGQKKNIFIHVPYIQGTPEEVWISWYHHALNAFGENCPGATAYLEAFSEKLKELMYHQLNLSASDNKIFTRLMQLLISDTQAMKAKVQEQLKNGRDRLLELSSFNAEAAGSIVSEIHESDGDFVLEELMERIFDQFGIMVEEIDARTYFLQPGANYYTDAFPTLRKEGMSITYDRNKALVREDVHFMTWDHPMVRGVVDLILGSEKGNCAFACVSSEDRGFCLESYYVPECLAPKHLNISQYLPAAPLKILLRHDLTEEEDEDLRGDLHADRWELRIPDQESIRPILTDMLDQSEAVAEAKLSIVIKQSLAKLDALHLPEIERLKYLKKINPHITDTEIKTAENEYLTIKGALKKMRLRCDSHCLIYKNPEASG